jgi:predicted RNA-binding Zn ribbon-like protein
MTKPLGRDRVNLTEDINQATQARALREWFRAFVFAHKGLSLGPDSLRELEPVNRILERDDAYGAIAVRSVDAPDRLTTSGLQWRTLRRWQTPDSLILPIAHAIASLLTSEDLSHVKACERSPCTLFFLDRTRSQARFAASSPDHDVRRYRTTRRVTSSTNRPAFSSLRISGRRRTAAWVSASTTVTKTKAARSRSATSISSRCASR